MLHFLRRSRAVLCLLLCVGPVVLTGCSPVQSLSARDSIHAPLPPGTELLPQPAFAKGLPYFGRGRRRMEGTVPVLSLEGGAFSMAGAMIGIPTGNPNDAGSGLIPVKQLPWNQTLIFSGRVQGTTARQTATVRAYATAPDTHILQSWQVETPLTGKAWKTFHLGMSLPPQTRALQVFVINGDQQAIRLSGFSLHVQGEARTHAPLLPVASAPASRPGECALFRVRLQVPVKTRKAGQTGTVSFPIGERRDDQFLVAFHAESKPAGLVKSVLFRQRPHSANWVCDARVAPGVQGAVVRWEGLFLVRQTPLSPLPRAASPEVPAEAAPWTQATAAVQSDDSGIQARSHALSTDAPDIETYARRVEKFTAGVPAVGKGWKSLDAVAGLKYGGTCTNRANLAAALLRAHGIPARTVAHMPAWSSEPLYEHWLVEYWHPRAGWTWMEPTLGKFQPERTSAVVLASSTPADENRAFEPLHCRYVMPGAAYLSVAEFSPTLYPADLFRDDAINTITPAGVLDGTPAEVSALCAQARRAANALFQQASAGRPLPDDRAALARSAQAGRAADVSRALAALAPISIPPSNTAR